VGGIAISSLRQPTTMTAVVLRQCSQIPSHMDRWIAAAGPAPTTV